MAEVICFIGSTNNFIGSTEDFIGCGSPVERGIQFILFRDGVQVSQETSTSFTITAEAVESTNKESGGFRELTPDAGTVNMTVNSSGVYTGSTVILAMLDDAINKTVGPYSIEYEFNNTTISSDFQVVSVEETGEHNGVMNYSVTLESSGTITVN